MQLIIDTLTDTPAQLTAAAHFLQSLSGGKVTAPRAEFEAPAPGNVVSTDIPPVPASASEPESPSNVPAAPSDTPAVSVSAASAVANAGSLDKAGFPWDARIHTANKAVIGNGTWRKKPGVSPELVIQVRAEWTNLSAQAASEVPPVPNAASAEVPDAPATDAPTGAIPDAPAPDTVPVAPTLTASDVLARCTEIQMTDASKGAALFQAIVGAGVSGGPMALPAVTDPAVLEAALAAVNAVAAG